MTRRERLERKLEKRQEWAEGRREDSSRRFAAADNATAGIEFGQPILVGHHSEKRHRAALAKQDANIGKGCESLAMAKHHDEKAIGLECQLESCIFSDDANAIAALESRIAAREAERDRKKAVNAAHKRFVKNQSSLDGAALTDAEKALVRSYKPAYSWEPHPYPPYVLTGLGAAIRRDRERIEEIKTRQARQAKAESAGGVSIERGGEWCRVTFAEKPDREILDALKAAGFQWGGGSWSGRASQLPENLVTEPAR